MLRGGGAMQISNNDGMNAAIQGREIDEILADSLPASDAPPWTLGVQRGGLFVEPSKQHP
jgi:hypothetical protein